MLAVYLVIGSQEIAEVMALLPRHMDGEGEGHNAHQQAAQKASAYGDYDAPIEPKDDDLSHVQDLLGVIDRLGHQKPPFRINSMMPTMAAAVRAPPETVATARLYCPAVRCHGTVERARLRPACPGG
jgi:hypothetical protein